MNIIVSCYFCGCLSCCRHPPFGATAIYVNIGLLFVCGVAAGFNYGRSVASIVHSFHLICMSVVIYATSALQYRDAVKVLFSIYVTWNLDGILFGKCWYFVLHSYCRPDSIKLVRYGTIKFVLSLYQMAWWHYGWNYGTYRSATNVLGLVQVHKSQLQSPLFFQNW